MIETRKCRVCQCDIKVVVKYRHGVRKLCSNCRTTKKKINHIIYKDRYNYGNKYRVIKRTKEAFKKCHSNIGIYLKINNDL